MAESGTNGEDYQFPDDVLLAFTQLVCNFDSVRFRSGKRIYKIKVTSVEDKFTSLLQNTAYWVFFGLFRHLGVIGPSGLGSELNRYLFAIIYMILTWSASMSLGAIIEEVRSVNLMVNAPNRPRTLQWWQGYDAVLNFVEEIDAFFGLYLVIFIGKWFAIFSHISFKMISDVMKEAESFPSYLIYLLGILFLFGMILFVTNRMKKKVNSLHYTGIEFN